MSATLGLTQLQECQTCALVFPSGRPLFGRNPSYCRQNQKKVQCDIPILLSFPPWPWIQGLQLLTALWPTLPCDFHVSEVSKMKQKFNPANIPVALALMGHDLFFEPWHHSLGIFLFLYVSPSVYLLSPLPYHSFIIDNLGNKTQNGLATACCKYLPESVILGTILCCWT